MFVHNKPGQPSHQNNILIIRSENGRICSSRLPAGNARAELEGEYNPGGMSHSQPSIYRFTPLTKQMDTGSGKTHVYA